MSLQAGLYSMLTWSSLVLFIMALTQSSHLSAELSTYVVLGGLPFAFAAGALGAHGRMLYAHKTAQRFHNAKASNLLRVRHRFWDAQEVEVTARWGFKRQWLLHILYMSASLVYATLWSDFLPQLAGTHWVAKAPMQHLCCDHGRLLGVSAVPLTYMSAGMRRDWLLHHPEGQHLQARQCVLQHNFCPVQVQPLSSSLPRSRPWHCADTTMSCSSIPLFCACRCARKQDQDRDYIPAWVAAAEAAYLEGKQQMPKSAYLHLRLACFLAAFKPVSKVSLPSCWPGQPLCTCISSWANGYHEVPVLRYWQAGASCSIKSHCTWCERVHSKVYANRVDHQASCQPDWVSMGPLLPFLCRLPLYHSWSHFSWRCPDYEG